LDTFSDIVWQKYERTAMRYPGLISVLVTVLLATTIVPLTAGSYTISTDSIYKHISILAADSLEGRETGSDGEWKAALYISSVFSAADLQPAGDSNSWYQAFDFIRKIDLGQRNSLKLNGVPLKLHEEYEPLPHSGSMEFQFDEIISVNYGITDEKSGYDDYADRDVEGKAVLIKRHTPRVEDSSEVDLGKHGSLTDKIVNALDHKAAGIFFYTTEDHDDTMLALARTMVTPKDIPIIWLRRAGIERLGLSLSDPAIKVTTGETELIPVRDTGYNVTAYLPGTNDTTIIVGAHYDHLGWGGPTSRYRGVEKKIHFGADDNGSGVAALLELARTYSAKRDELKYSYLMVAFSGEEKGLLGSTHFVRNMPVDSSKVRMMLNMDMIGRLKDQDKGLAILGTGTCQEFKTYFDSLEIEDIKIAQKESGTGPTDHTPFYNNNIPVLHFFTGAHTDYHTPDDVLDKIDAAGIVRVAAMIDQVLMHFDQLDAPLVFQRTKDKHSGRYGGEYSVTLGIMPDFISEVRGLGVDGISEGKAADLAGIKKGDVIIRIGSLVIDDIYTYMSALGKYRKGDSTTVIVERGSDTLSLQVEFK
jgi:aminopeptidase YwaD